MAPGTRGLAHSSIGFCLPTTIRNKKNANKTNFFSGKITSFVNLQRNFRISRMETILWKEANDANAKAVKIYRHKIYKKKTEPAFTFHINWKCSIA